MRRRPFISSPIYPSLSGLIHWCWSLAWKEPGQVNEDAVVHSLARPRSVGQCCPSSLTPSLPQGRCNPSSTTVYSQLGTHTQVIKRLHAWRKINTKKLAKKTAQLKWNSKNFYKNAKYIAQQTPCWTFVIRFSGTVVIRTSLSRNMGPRLRIKPTIIPTPSKPAADALPHLQGVMLLYRINNSNPNLISKPIISRFSLALIALHHLHHGKACFSNFFNPSTSAISLTYQSLSSFRLTLSPAALNLWSANSCCFTKLANLLNLYPLPPTLARAHSLILSIPIVSPLSTPSPSSQSPPLLHQILLIPILTSGVLFLSGSCMFAKWFLTMSLCQCY